MKQRLLPRPRRRELLNKSLVFVFEIRNPFAQLRDKKFGIVLVDRHCSKSSYGTITSEGTVRCPAWAARSCTRKRARGVIVWPHKFEIRVRELRKPYSVCALCKSPKSSDVTNASARASQQFRGSRVLRPLPTRGYIVLHPTRLQLVGTTNTPGRTVPNPGHASRRSPPCGAGCPLAARKALHVHC